MKQNNLPPSLDHLIAQFNIMTTDFILNRHQCNYCPCRIAQQLQRICHHQELTFFPEQQTIYLKMLKVWKALAYDRISSPIEQLSNSKKPKKSNTVQVMH